MSVLRNNRPPVTISLTAVFLININDFSFHRMKKKNIIIYVIAFIKCSKTDFSTWEGKKGLEGCSNMDVERNVILANWISMRNGGVTWRRNLRTHSICIFWNLNENCLFIHCRWSNWYLMWHLMQSFFFFLRICKSSFLQNSLSVASQLPPKLYLFYYFTVWKNAKFTLISVGKYLISKYYR